MSGLKLRQTEMERENSELRRKLQLLDLSDSLNNNSTFEKDPTPSRGATSYFDKNRVFSQSCSGKSQGRSSITSLHVLFKISTLSKLQTK